MKKNNTKAASVNFIVDNAFTPDMTERNEPMTNSQRLHNEAGDYVNRTFNPMEHLREMMQNVVISSTYIAEPKKNGEHHVRVYEVEDPKSGYNGNEGYTRIWLIDVDEDNRWSTDIRDSRFAQAFTAINEYNGAMLHKAYKDGEDLIEYVKSHSFKVWTVKSEGKKTNTYFDRNLYDKACWAIAYKENLKGLKEKK